LGFRFDTTTRKGREVMKRYVVLFVLALTVASLGTAGTTGRLTGTVHDDQGQPLPGATVTISSPTEIGGAKVEVADADGNFAFQALGPGYYSVKIELSGFVDQERNEVQVRLDRTTELNVTMPLAKFAEEVTVVAETPVVDPTQVSTSQTFTPDFLKGVAVVSGRRQYQSVLDMAPGTVDDGGNPHVYGSSDSENVYLIDGLNTTDPVTATFGTNFTFDAIQEISFQTGGYEAEYGQAIGGVVNVVTKSGGNDFSGSLDIRYNSTSFYQNGDHFNRDDNKTKFLNPGATLGGPILRDKLWFFAAYEFADSQATPNESPTTRKFKSNYYLGKLTWQATPGWRLTAKYSGDPADIDNANADALVAPEATAFQTQGADVYQGDASGVLGANLLWNIGVGVYRSVLDAYPQNGDLDTAGHYNYLTGMSTGNYTNAQYSKRDRDEYKTNLTWFADNLAGSHEFKGGLEYSKLDFWWHSFTPAGGYDYRDVTEGYVYGGDSDVPAPWNLVQTTDPGPAPTSGKVQTAYLQDAWKVTPNVTLKLGVRYDQAAYSNDANVEIAKLDMVQPRLGFAWDVTGDAKNVVKASWGRFMHPSATTLPNYTNTHLSTSYQWYSCSSQLGASTPDECEQFALSQGWRWTAGPDNWDPNGWITTPGDVTGSEPSRVQDNIKPAYADELIVGFERELFTKTSIEVSYVDKKTKRIIDDTCQGNLSGGTVEDDNYCAYYIIGNVFDLKRDYKGAIVKFETRATDWMWLLASYTYATSKGNVESTYGGSAAFDFCPEQCVNRYGYLSDDRRHRVKVNGYFNLPANLTLGVDAFWSSAFAYSKTRDTQEFFYGTEFLEPRGNYRASSNSQLDLSLTYRLKLGPLHTEIIGSVLNVLNTEQVSSICQDADGCGGKEWGQANDWQNPRRFEVGFRIEF
jgi:outer membrane receptor protein involved in Fe transport